MSRRTACAAAALVLLGGCGDDATTHGPPRSAPEITYDRAAAIVRASLLKPADLPGYTMRKVKAKDDPFSESEVLTCFDLPAEDIRSLVTDNRTFVKGAVEVYVTTDAARTAAGARAVVAELNGENAVPCVEKYFTYGAAVEHITMTKVTGRRIPLRIPGATAVYGIALDMTGTYQDATLRFTGYAIGALAGLVRIDVNSFGVSAASHSVGSALPLSTAKVLLARATARAAEAARRT